MVDGQTLSVSLGPWHQVKCMKEGGKMAEWLQDELQVLCTVGLGQAS